MTIIHTAANAIHHQFSRLADSAARTASLGRVTHDEDYTPPDLAEEVAIRTEADAAVRANLSVIRAEDDRLGQLLDTFI